MARRRVLALLSGLLACGIMAGNVASWRSDPLSRLRTPRRYWEDVSIAISRHVTHGPSLPTVDLESSPGADLRHAYQRYVSRAADAAGIRPWEPWRTVPIRRALRRERLEGRPFDDPGRAMPLTLGFQALGGVSPYLGLWLGVLACVPVLLWTSWELSEAGRPVAAALFPATLACSPYVVEMLSLPYSAVGFYLLALIALAPLAIYALAGRSRSPTFLLLRALAAGGAFAVCVLCRAGTLLLLPGFLLALALAARRVVPSSWARAALLGLVATGFFLVPYAALRPPRHHAAWSGVWEGFGDFDRTKGHAWFDPEARKALTREGLRFPEGHRR